jgi:hypothetical protein
MPFDQHGNRFWSETHLTPSKLTVILAAASGTFPGALYFEQGQYYTAES